jgi:hypothetical protein
MIALLLSTLLDVSELDPPPFAPWFSARAVEVSIARPASGAPWIRAMSELPSDAERVHSVLADLASYRQIFAPVVIRSDVLESSPGLARVHFVWNYPFPFRDRDAVVAYEDAALPDGGYRIAWRDDARPGDPRTGVRIVRVAGETRIEPVASTSCRVTYTFLGELGGRIPSAFAQKAWRAEPVGYVNAVRRRLGLSIPPP